MNGFLLIDKPVGPTSNAVLSRLKKKFSIKKMGHTGTLDPFASGLLVVGLGEALKMIPYLKEEPKVYEATVKLGVATDTLDLTGQVIKQCPYKALSLEEIKAKTADLKGEIAQVPPMYSAKKVQGQKLYRLARQGREVERKPVKVTLHELEWINNDGDSLSFRVSCSRGTYVRSLAETIAEKLGTVGHLTSLKRMRAGDFDLTRACQLDEDFNLNESLVSITDSLQSLKSVQVDTFQSRKLIQGQPIDKVIQDQANSYFAIFNDKNFLGIGEKKGSQIRPKRMMSL